MAEGRSRRMLWLGLGGLAALLLLGLAVLLSGVLDALGMKQRVDDLVPPELPAEIVRGAPSLLLFSKTAGFRHEDAIPAAQRSVLAIAQRRGWKTFATENAAVFNDAQLARVDVIFGNNSTGDNWTAEQKAAFQRYIDGGGGYVGVHGAAGTRYRFWDWYTDALLLGSFVGHPMFPQLQQAAVVVRDAAHPAMRQLPTRWMRRDEWYSFEKSARELGAHVLATLDEDSYEAEAFGQDLRMGDHPIVWVHCSGGGGRIFYSALGHEGEAYRDPAHEQMLEGALAWAIGIEGACPGAASGR